MSPQPHIIWIIAGSLLLLAGAATALYALFADRSRGRRRCPSCFYSMDGATGLLCPECGRTARSQRTLHRTRRRWRLALIGCGILTLGAGAIAWPIARAKNPWTLLPHPALAWAMVRSDSLNRPQMHKLLNAFVPASLDRSEYERVIGVYAVLLRRPQSSRMMDALEYRLGTPTVAADGSIIVRGGGGGFVWHLHDETTNTYSLLSDAVALDYADALVARWRSDMTFTGEMAGRELRRLAYWHPAVAKWAVQRLHGDSLDWPVFAIDPRSMNAEVLHTLLHEYRGPDPRRRSRAALVLTASYFEITVHWTRYSGANLELQQQYPDYAQLRQAAQLAGDDLLAVAKSNAGERQRTAVLALAQHRLVWEEQCRELISTSDSLPEDLVPCLTGNRPQE
jgi:hypothetical protein